MKNVNIELVVIDPQNDFCSPHGSLYVKGAELDMERLARLVVRLKHKLNDIHVTLDSHRRVDISHPIWWKDSAGKPPAPFTVITPAEVRASKWTTAAPSAYKRSLAYLDTLQATNRYAHVIWPEHCLIGDEGHNIAPVFSAAVHEWESRYAQANFITKGSNPWTEHFSGVRAEVPDMEDPSTQLNTDLIKTLANADIILLAGEARSHCVANTVQDIVAAFADPDCIRKIHLLTDATSDVDGFQHLGNAFLDSMRLKGMRTTTTTDFLI